MKTYIVTGASGGIGEKIIHKLLLGKNIVFAADIQIEPLDALKSKFQEFGDNLIVEILDVRKPELWEKIIQKAAKQKLPFYGLIHSAGVLLPAFIKDSRWQDIDFHIDINTKGSLYGSQIAAKYFSEKRSGHIIHIASLAGISPVPGIALYSASKFAVRGFSLALAMELSEFNVHVTCICPDAVNTAMLDLQKDYVEAALTFSGSKALTADEVSDAVISVIGKNTMEIILPSSRGLEAKFASFFPQLASKILSVYRNKGLKNQKKFKEQS